MTPILLGRVLVRHRYLPVPKNASKNPCQIFRVERSIRNITCKLCAICAKQSARNARICGRTKIGFCTVITPHRIPQIWLPVIVSCFRNWRGKNRRRIRRYSTNYKTRLSAHPNKLVTNLMTSLDANGRFKKHQPQDLLTRF